MYGLLPVLGEHDFGRTTTSSQTEQLLERNVPLLGELPRAGDSVFVVRSSHELIDGLATLLRASHPVRIHQSSSFSL